MAAGPLTPECVLTCAICLALSITASSTTVPTSAPSTARANSGDDGSGAPLIIVFATLGGAAVLAAAALAMATVVGVLLRRRSDPGAHGNVPTALADAVELTPAFNNSICGADASIQQANRVAALTKPQIERLSPLVDHTAAREAARRKAQEHHAGVRTLARQLSGRLAPAVGAPAMGAVARLTIDVNSASIENAPTPLPTPIETPRHRADSHSSSEDFGDDANTLSPRSREHVEQRRIEKAKQFVAETHRRLSRHAIFTQAMSGLAGGDEGEEE